MWRRQTIRQLLEGTAEHVREKREHEQVWGSSTTLEGRHFVMAKEAQSSKGLLREPSLVSKCAEILTERGEKAAALSHVKVDRSQDRARTSRA
jgi:hypothetical protein